jgi:hypothetical protein
MYDSALHVVVRVPDDVDELLRYSKAVDEKLREQQTGFRKDRSCTDKIAALQIIIERSLEWNTFLFLNFVDFEKAVDLVKYACCVTKYLKNRESISLQF